MLLVASGLGAGEAAAGSGSGAAPATSVRADGRILEASEIPDPSASIYSNCLFTVKIVPRRDGRDLPPVLLALQAFVNRKLTPHAGLQAGDRIRVLAVPFSEMPPDYCSQQMSDTIEDLDLDLWAGLEVAVVGEDDPPGARPGAATLPAGRMAVPVVPAEVSADAREQRGAAIREDLARIQGLLAARGSWEAWFDACFPYRRELQALADADADGHLVNGRSTVIHPASAISYQFSDEDPRYQRVLAAMENLCRQFRRAGTDLIVCPIPLRDEVYAAAFIGNPPADGVLQPYRLKFLHDLLVRGIEAVDLVPVLRETLASGRAPYHDNTLDGHLAGEGARAAGEFVAERLHRYPFAASPVTYALAPVAYACPGEFDGAHPREVYQAFRVCEPDGGQVAHGVEESEVLVIGDSMLTAPPQVLGAGLGSHLMRPVGIPLTFFKRAGAAPRIARSLAREAPPTFFSRRKVCVFFFAFGYLIRTDASWATDPFLDQWMEQTASPPGAASASAVTSGIGGGR